MALQGDLEGALFAVSEYLRPATLPGLIMGGMAPMKGEDQTKGAIHLTLIISGSATSTSF